MTGREKLKPADVHGLGDAIRAARTRAGYDQPTLAYILGVTKGSISAWECGRAAPGVARLANICRALRTTPNELLGFTEAA